MNDAPEYIHPYRVEWRYNLTTRWSHIMSTDDYNLAMEQFNATYKHHGGQVRIVRQEVARVMGLGAAGL